MSSDSIVGAILAIADAWAVPGGVLVITDRDKVIVEHAFGFADLDRGRAVTADHLFEIGSISKIMTATVVLQLVEQGRLRLDDTAGSILDWLPSALAGPEITIERLLTHTAGLISGVDAVPDEKAQLGGLSMAPPEGAAERFFHYSNLGFILLGQIAARVSGRSLPELVSEGILAPVGATASVSTVTYSDRGALARGYQPRDDDRPWRPGDPLDVAPFLEVAGADGNVATTGRDLAAFARMLLGRGTTPEGQVVLSTDSFDAMTTRLAPAGEDVLVLDGVPRTSDSRYGFGINVERSDDRLVVTHGGGMVGYASFLLADVDAGFAVVVLTNANGDGPIAEALARTAAALHAEPGDAGPHALSPQLWRSPDESDQPDIRPRMLSSGMTGDFVGSMGQLEIRSMTADSGLVSAEVRLGDSVGQLQWTWGARVLTDIPALRPYPLEFDGTNWVCGGTVFRPAMGKDVEVAADADADAELAVAASTDDQKLSAFCGHFRAYTPWFTNFRTVLRGGVLVMVASPGVEAPGDDVVLVPLENGLFRIGEDPRLPERLQFGPAIDGVAQWADRDGCRYSRSFTPDGCISPNTKGTF